MEFSSMAGLRRRGRITANALWKCSFIFAPSFPSESRRSSNFGRVDVVPGDRDEVRQRQHWETSSRFSAWCGCRLAKANSSLGPEGGQEDTRMKDLTTPDFVASRVANLQAQLISRPGGEERTTGREHHRLGDVFGKLCSQGELDKAFDILKLMEESGTVPAVHMYSSLLKVCAKKKVLRQAKQLHAHLAKYELDKTRFLGEFMVYSFVKCGGLEDAHQLFEELQDRTVFSWTAIISGLAMSEKCQEALRMYERMLQEGVLPNAYTFVSLLKACGSLGELVEGKWIHAQIVKHRCGRDLFVQTCLVDMYGKCGSLVDAHRVFCGLSQRDVVSWTAMITACVQQGRAEKALQLHEQMQAEGVNPNEHSIAIALQACGILADKEEGIENSNGCVKAKALDGGKAIHAVVLRNGYELDIFVGSALVSMYGKCGSIVAARTVFDGLSQRNVVTWNAMLMAYAEQGEAEKFMQLYELMREGGTSPNDRTFVSVLQVCGMLAGKEDGVVVHGNSTKVKSLERGKAVHADAQRLGYHSNLFIGNSLINVFGQCGSMADAQQMFDMLPLRDVVGWTAMLKAYVNHYQAEKAFLLYEQMREEGPSPDIHTFTTVLQACTMLAQKEEGSFLNGRCTKLSSVMKGKSIHVETRRKGYGADAFINNTLVSMYGKCGRIDDASYVFDNLLQLTVVSWNAMLAAYVDDADSENALQLYEHMLEEGVSPDAWTFVSTLQACGISADREVGIVVNGQCTKVMSLEQGKVIHADARLRSYGSDVFVGSALIRCYGKCGRVADACNVFDQLPHKDVVAWTAMLAVYSEHGEASMALQLYETMRKENISPNDRAIVSALQACGVFAAKDEHVCDETSVRLKSLEMVKAIHADAWAKYYDLNVLVGSTLILLYGKCRSFVDSENVFDRLSQSDVVALTAMATSYKEQGQPERVLTLYGQMQEEGVSPDVQMILVVLQACGVLAEKEEYASLGEKVVKANALNLGRTIHAEGQRKGCTSNAYVGSTLVRLYGNCGSIVDARTVFDEMMQQNVELWNPMLATYAEQGHVESCLQLYEQMREQGDSPDAHTFVSILQACGKLTEKAEDGVSDEQLTRMKALEIGKAVHADAYRIGCGSDTFVGNTAVSLYGKCGSMIDARGMFDGMSHRTVVSWNVMLATYAEHKQGEKALQLYNLMQEEGVSADVWTLVAVLQACGVCAEDVDSLSCKGQLLQMGKVVHAEAQRKRYDANLFLCSTLVRMYSKCGSIIDAQSVFHGLSQLDVVLWNSMVAAYLEQGHAEKALQSYEELLQRGMIPDALTIINALQAIKVLADEDKSIQVDDGQSIKPRALQKVKAICAAAQEKRYEVDGFMSNILVGVYGKCGSIRDAETIFNELSHQSTISWNVMLAAYAGQDDAEKTLQVYEQMLEDGVSADSETFVCALQLCGILADKEIVADVRSCKVTVLRKVKTLHAEAWRKGCKADVFVGSTLISAYGKCGAIWEVQNVFKDGFYRDSVVSWNTVFEALVQHGEDAEALQLYNEMQKEGVVPNKTTLVCILRACSNTGNLDTLRQIHDTFLSLADYSCPFLASALVSAYGKCASMVDAQRVFDTLPCTDGVTWNALIAGYAREGNYFKSLQCYNQMRFEGIVPDKVTFLSIISACSHAGLVDEGVELFESMNRDYAISPEFEHLVSMVDLFSRTGCFAWVQAFLQNMPMLPDLAVWLCVLAACRKHGNVVFGKMAFSAAVHLSPKHAAAYALMSSIYSDAGLMDHAEKVNILRNTNCTPKEAGQTWIQYEQQANIFLARAITVQTSVQFTGEPKVRNL